MSSDRRITAGVSGLEALEIQYAFGMGSELHRVLGLKIRSYDTEQREYAYRSFMGWFSELEPVPSDWTARVLLERLAGDDWDTYNALSFVSSLDHLDPWFLAFSDAMDSFQLRNADIPF